MPRLMLYLCATALLAVSAQAQEGKYVGSGEGGELAATIKSIDGDRYAITLEVGTDGCGGSVSGEASQTESGFELSAPNETYEAGSDNPIMAEEFCKVDLSFDADGMLTIQEQRGCLSYHGAACEFTGQLVNQSAAQ